MKLRNKVDKKNYIFAPLTAFPELVPKQSTHAVVSWSWPEFRELPSGTAARECSVSRSVDIVEVGRGGVEWCDAGGP